MRIWPISSQAAPERGDNTGISVGPPLQGGKERGCIHTIKRLVERHLDFIKRLASKRVSGIPTRVGQTPAVPPEPPESYGSSPRVWGRRLARLPCELASPGSSPRVWGRRQLGVSSGMTRRFIPTRVGQTVSARVWRVFRTVHPHACGADGDVNLTKSAVSGSSPRVWGRLTSADL